MKVIEVGMPGDTGLTLWIALEDNLQIEVTQTSDVIGGAYVKDISAGVGPECPGVDMHIGNKEPY